MACRISEDGGEGRERREGEEELTTNFRSVEYSELSAAGRPVKLSRLLLVVELLLCRYEICENEAK